MIIPQAVHKILSQITVQGFEAYTVGGCVRDILMGKSPCDWDITTSATPVEIQKIFTSYPVIPSGIKHGTVTVIVDKIPFEITTFRIDGSYKDSRHPESVMFSSNITEDLKRRDFTINAMAYNPDKGIIDPFEGRSDLNNRIIRAVGNPEERFSEDALRIMRAIRFSAVLGFKIEPATSDALHKSRHLLDHIAAERITTELNKILCADNVTQALEKYFAVVSQRLFGLYPSMPFDAGVFQCISRLPDRLSLRLAAFLFCAAQMFNQDINSLTKTFFSNLKYDNKTRRLALTLLENLYREILPDKISIRRIIRDIGADRLQDVFELKKALQLDTLSELDISKSIFCAVLRDKACCHLQDLAVDGNDLAFANLNGSDIGKALNTLLDAVIEDKCQNTKSALIEYFKKVK